MITFALVLSTRGSFWEWRSRRASDYPDKVLFRAHDGTGYHDIFNKLVVPRYRILMAC